MKRGPAPMAPTLKALVGGRLSAPPPKPTPIAPKCPSWLPPDAKKLWRRLAPELERLGLLTAADGPAFAALCLSYARWREAEEALDHLVVKGDRGRDKKHPAAQIARDYMQAMRGWCVEFGLTPAARERLTLQAPEDDEAAGILD